MAKLGFILLMPIVTGVLLVIAHKIDEVHGQWKGEE